MSLFGIMDSSEEVFSFVVTLHFPGLRMICLFMISVFQSASVRGLTRVSIVILHEINVI